MKLRIYRDYELDESGVTTVWAWECPDEGCHERSFHRNAALYWDNIIRSANSHLAWHSQKASQG